MNAEEIPPIEDADSDAEEWREVFQEAADERMREITNDLNRMLRK